jgi:hypothetical protein
VYVVADAVVGEVDDLDRVLTPLVVAAHPEGAHRAVVGGPEVARHQVAVRVVDLDFQIRVVAVVVSADVDIALLAAVVLDLVNVVCAVDDGGVLAALAVACVRPARSVPARRSAAARRRSV